MKNNSEHKEEKLLRVNTLNEQIVLATMMKNKTVMARLANELEIDSFMGRRHRIIFSILQKLANNHAEFNVDSFLATADDVGDYGGVKYLKNILSHWDENKNIEYHVSRLKTDTLKYRLSTEYLQEVQEAAEDPGSEFDQILESIDDLRNKVISSNVSAKLLPPEKIKEEYLRELQDSINDDVEFVGTGFKELDEYLVTGLKPKKMTLIFGRPSHGKSAVVSNIVMRSVLSGKRVLMLPLEAGRHDQITTYISTLTKITLNIIEKNPQTITPKMLAKIKKQLDELFDTEHLHIYDGSITTSEMLALAEMKQFDLVVCDLYENLSDVSLDQGRIAENLKFIQEGVKRTNAHFLFTTQQRRKYEASDTSDKRPKLEKIKNSGAFEERFDNIFGLYRDKMEDPDADDDVIEISILKQRRGGNVGRVVCYEFIGETQTVGEFRADYQEDQDHPPFMN